MYKYCYKNSTRLQDGKLKINITTNDNGKIKKYSNIYNVAKPEEDKELFDWEDLELVDKVRKHLAEDLDYYNRREWDDVRIELDNEEFELYKKTLLKTKDILAVIDPEGFNNTAILKYVIEVRDECKRVLRTFEDFEDNNKGNRYEFD